MIILDAMFHRNPVPEIEKVLSEYIFLSGNRPIPIIIYLRKCRTILKPISLDFNIHRIVNCSSQQMVQMAFCIFLQKFNKFHKLLMCFFCNLVISSCIHSVKPCI